MTSTSRSRRSPSERHRIRRIIGIDFSGAADAGRKIWIAQCRIVGGRLRVDRCDPASALFGCTAGPEASCAALVAYLRALGPAAVGCDFPFSLAAPMVQASTWPEFLAGFAWRYPTAAVFHARSHRQWGEPRRRCDGAAKTPFAPTNCRLYRQSYHGIRDVLAPLIGAGAARALPLQAPSPGVPWLLECCPASALKLLGCYRPYKGAGVEHARQRLAILRMLEANGVARVSAGMRRTLVAQTGGDALDSVVAAWIAFRTLGGPDALPPIPPGWPPLEGFVYAGFPIMSDAGVSSSAPAGHPRPAEWRKARVSMP